MIEPTREQLAKIDQLADLYDSVECRPKLGGTSKFVPLNEPGVPPDVKVLTFQNEIVVEALCWDYRPSGAKLLAHALTIHPDGTESDRR